MDDLRVTIRIACVFPSVCKADVEALARTDCSFSDRKMIEASVERQVCLLLANWGREVGCLVDIDHRVRICDTPVTAITMDKSRQGHPYRITEPSLEVLAGSKLFQWADCFLIWIPFDAAVFSRLGKRRKLDTGGECMWIPTTESRELENLQSSKARDAASHELKHWVKNSLAGIGVTGMPSPDGKNSRLFWNKLREALTDANIKRLNEFIRCRCDERRRNSC